MAYRDELEAARARVAMLERQLAEAGQGEEAEEIAQLRAERGALRAERDALDARLADMEQALVGAVAHSEAVAREMSAVGRAMAPAPAGTPTLTEHNRRFAPMPFVDSSGVRCPWCAATGEDVEMMRGGPFLFERWWTKNDQISNRRPKDAKVKVANVLCPRCCHFGTLRLE